MDPLGLIGEVVEAQLEPGDRMAIPKNPPEWAKAISAVGRTMAQQPTTQVGEMAPRLLLSVPTVQLVVGPINNCGGSETNPVGILTVT